MDYKDYPVDYFHGIPEISFPLYTLKCGSIDVPIILSYHGGGIRVEQKVGNAGLGWSVSYGAVISHTIYGAPDDAFNSSKLHGLWHLDSDETNFRNNLIKKVADYDPTNGTHYKNNLSWEGELGVRYYEGLTDIANDLFNLYGLDLSANFALTNNRTVVCSSDKPIKIKTIPQGNLWQDGGCDNYGFDVETNSGLKYRFSTQDRTKYEYWHGSPLLNQTLDSIYYSSAWHLDQIADLNGNIINFKYSPGKTFILKGFGHSVDYGYSNPDLAKMSQSHINRIGCIKYFSQTIQSIQGAGINIKFGYLSSETSNREALIKNITITAPDKTERVITFDYQGCLLVKVTDQNEPIYSFEYNLENGTSPEFYYEDQDFGGYYNNAFNSGLIPYVVNSSGQIGGGANRSVVPEFAKEASLHRISYATGGYTEFEWESNSFSQINSHDYNGKINNDVVTSINTDTIRACLEPGYEKLKISEWRIQQGQMAELDMTKYFNMNPANLFGSAYHDSHIYDVYPNINPPHYPHLVIRDHNTSKILQILYLDEQTIEPSGFKAVTKLYLSPGTYDFELIHPYEVQGAEDFIETEFRFHDSICGYIFLRKISTNQLTSIGNQNWCGLRIKRIISCAGADENDLLRKDFYYNQDGNPNTTTGTVQQLPYYDYMYYKKIPSTRWLGYEGSEVYCVGEFAFPQTTTGAISGIQYPVVSTYMGREDPQEPDSYLRYFYESSFFQVVVMNL